MTVLLRNTFRAWIDCVPGAPPKLIMIGDVRVPGWCGGAGQGGSGRDRLTDLDQPVRFPRGDPGGGGDEGGGGVHAANSAGQVR